MSTIATFPSAPSGPQGSGMQQLTIFICEQDHWHHRPLYLAILELVRAQGGAGATVLKGLAGYSASSRMIRTSNLVDVVPIMPLVILIVDEAARIAALLPPLEEMIGANGGLITVVDVVSHRYRHPSVHPGSQVKVRQLMEPRVVTVGPDTPVADLLPLLLNKFYKALPVVDAERRVLGMVTDVDLLEKADLGLPLSVVGDIQERGAQGFEELVRALRTSGKTARDIMGSRPEAVIGPDASLEDAVRRMVEQGVKRLPVVDRERRLLGIVSRLDILKASSQVPPTSGPEAGAPLPANARTLRDVMLPDVLAVVADTPLATVVDTLVGSQGARRVVVTDGTPDRHVVGIITESDLVKRVAAQSRPGLVRMLREGLSFLGLSREEQERTSRLQTRIAREVMTAPAITASESMSITEAIQFMTSQEVKVLPVTDAAGRLVGIVNRARLLRALLDQLDAPDASAALPPETATTS